jgi:putative ABC transport system substrate-binding protein
MRRRDLIKVIASSAVAWPLAARSQQRTMPVIGFLNSGTPNAMAHFAVAFREGLEQTGYVDGRNVHIEYRWAEGQYDQLPALAADLVRQKVSVIFAAGGALPTVAAKAATTPL